MRLSAFLYMKSGGTNFKDLPDDWMCPICGVGKEEFSEQ